MRALLLVALLLAGCAGAPAAVAPERDALRFGEPAPVDPAVIASEPDVAALPDGTLLACGVGRRSEDEMYLWRRPPGGAWERVPHPQGRGAIDCAWSVDAGGTAYYVTSAGDTVTVAATRDGLTWDAEATLGQGDAAWDRPWVAGGEAGEAVVIAYGASGGLSAWRTEDGGGTWQGPALAQPPDLLVFQSFSNVAWRGRDAYVLAFAPLEPRGAGFEPHDLWLARSDDGGATWEHELVAPDRGNLNNIFPSVAADADGRVHVAWAESGEGGAPVQAFLLSEGSPPRALHGLDRTGLMPRVAATPRGPAVAFYAAPGGIQPSFDEARWDLVVVRGNESVVVAEGVHEGTVATGGYGAIASHFAANAGDLGTSNSQELLHNLGLVVGSEGALVAAWAADAAREVGLFVAEQRDPRLA